MSTFDGFITPDYKSQEKNQYYFTLPDYFCLKLSLITFISKHLVFYSYFPPHDIDSSHLGEQ